jgi:hypothetical protein
MITVAKLRRWALAQDDSTYEDIFTKTDLRLPPGTRVLRDEAEIQKWIDAWGPDAVLPEEKET